MAHASNQATEWMAQIRKLLHRLCNCVAIAQTFQCQCSKLVLRDQYLPWIL